MAKTKALVALSGGVDSSMAAHLLQEQGYELLGVFLRLGINKDRDEEHARRVCEFLGIKFYPVDVSRRFHREVIDYFVDSYSRGLTPNPCIKCNKTVKFRELIKFADNLGFDHVATGHYARIGSKEGTYRLYAGRDERKDQSYFLYQLTSRELKRVLFPLGEYKKEEIKKRAEKEGVPFYDSESQDICFITGDHNEFLKQRLEAEPGPIKTLQERTVGKHHGLPFYTIGQRKGIEVGEIGPLYAVKRDYNNNTLYVTDDNQDPSLYSEQVVAGNFNWISGEERQLPLSCSAMVRYGQQPYPCRVQKRKGKDEYLIEFDSPQRAITPGQSIVVYDEEEVLGGGIIEESY